MHTRITIFTHAGTSDWDEEWCATGEYGGSEKAWEPSGVGLQWSLPVELLVPTGQRRKQSILASYWSLCAMMWLSHNPETWGVSSSDSTGLSEMEAFIGLNTRLLKKKILKIPLTLWIWFNTTQPNEGEVREKKSAYKLLNLSDDYVRGGCHSLYSLVHIWNFHKVFHSSFECSIEQLFLRNNSLLHIHKSLKWARSLSQKFCFQEFTLRKQSEMWEKMSLPGCSLWK